MTCGETTLWIFLSRTPRASRHAERHGDTRREEARLQDHTHSHRAGSPPAVCPVQEATCSDDQRDHGLTPGKALVPGSPALGRSDRHYVKDQCARREQASQQPPSCSAWGAPAQTPEAHSGSSTCQH